MTAKTTTNTPAIGSAVVSSKGAGTLLAVAKGWASIQTESGETIKARANDVRAAGTLPDGYVRHGIAVYRPADYTKHEVKTASGRRVYDRADEVADQLRGLDLDAQYALVAKTTGETQKSLRERYAALNPGQQRMNLGNKLRGFARKQAEA